MFRNDIFCFGKRSTAPVVMLGMNELIYIYIISVLQILGMIFSMMLLCAIRKSQEIVWGRSCETLPYLCCMISIPKLSLSPPSSDRWEFQFSDCSILIGSYNEKRNSRISWFCGARWKKDATLYILKLFRLHHEVVVLLMMSSYKHLDDLLNSVFLCLFLKIYIIIIIVLLPCIKNHHSPKIRSVSELLAPFS